MFPVLKPLIPATAERPVVDGLPVVDLGPDAGGVLEPDQLDHAALVPLVARAAPHPHARVLEALRDRVKRRRVGHLPADDLEIIAPPVAELDQVVMLVHPE